MSASLGSTTYSSVTWTAGDIVTEAKMDAMVANDQAYDSHAAEGYLANNNKSFAGKDTGGSNRNLIKMSSGDEVHIGDADNAADGEHIVPQQAVYQGIQTYSPSVGGTATIDLAKGNHHAITMPAGNITIAISNAAVGEKFTISILQDGTGSRTVTWFSTIRWAGGSAPTLTTTASKRDTFGFLVTGSGTYDGFFIGFNA